MGQAKQRGTFEQRKAQAIANGVHTAERAARESRKPLRVRRAPSGALLITALLATATLHNDKPCWNAGPARP
jgi:hypothetical protein